MSSVLTQSADCCVPCPDIPITQVPGPAGADGAPGTDGTDGSNAFTDTTAGFTMPAVSANVTVAVADTGWMSVGQVVFVENAGYFTVNSVLSAVSVSLTNLGYDGNAAPASLIASSQHVSPGGLVGPEGATPTSTLNDLSPTTTRGDLIVDNGANSPDASDVRLPVGTDGQLLTAQSAQPTGLLWSSVIPNASGSTDNVIPRFNTPGGTEEPAPLQLSGLLVTDTTALQTIGGNARGTSAVDLQPVRGAATQVASGANSALSGGLNNTASGATSSVGGGTTNLASGTSSHIGGGDTNQATNSLAVVGGGNANVGGGVASVIGGGTSNSTSNPFTTVGGGTTNEATSNGATVAGGETGVASGDHSTIGGGINNQASAQYSCIPGGALAVASHYGQVAHAAGAFSTEGDAQTSELLWRGATANATPAEIFLDGSSLRATVPTNTTWAFEIIGLARRSNGDSITFEVKGGIKNDAGTVVLVAAVTATVIADGTGGALTIANFTVSADDPNNALIITVTGVAAQNWRWVARARLVEVGF